MDEADVDVDHIQFETDVLVIGGGGAGAAAAIEAARQEPRSSWPRNCAWAMPIRAWPRIQAADKEHDSPAAHYLDAMGGGH